MNWTVNPLFGEYHKASDPISIRPASLLAHVTALVPPPQEVTVTVTVESTPAEIERVAV